MPKYTMLIFYLSPKIIFNSDRNPSSYSAVALKNSCASTMNLTWSNPVLNIFLKNPVGTLSHVRDLLIMCFVGIVGKVDKQ